MTPAKYHARQETFRAGLNLAVAFVFVGAAAFILLATFAGILAPHPASRATLYIVRAMAAGILLYWLCRMREIIRTWPGSHKTGDAAMQPAYLAGSFQSPHVYSRPLDPKYHIQCRFDLTEFTHAASMEIVKTSNGEAIPHDEPVILFRARDMHALPALEYYRDTCQAYGCNQYQLDGIDNRIQAFRLYGETNPDKMKQPGVTRGL